jgi:hypothetical protein
MDLFVGEKNMLRPSRKTEFLKLETGNAADTDDAAALQGQRQEKEEANITLMFQNS